MSILTHILIWACFILGGVLIVATVTAAGILGWCWARDQWDKARNWWGSRHPAPADIAGKTSLTAAEQLDLRRIEQGYGDAPKALLRRLR
jgi:hypothetical protein